MHTNFFVGLLGTIFLFAENLRKRILTWHFSRKIVVGGFIGFIVLVIVAAMTLKWPLATAVLTVLIVLIYVAWSFAELKGMVRSCGGFMSHLFINQIFFAWLIMYGLYEVVGLDLFYSLLSDFESNPLFVLVAFTPYFIFMAILLIMWVLSSLLADYHVAKMGLHTINTIIAVAFAIFNLVASAYPANALLWMTQEEYENMLLMGYTPISFLQMMLNALLIPFLLIGLLASLFVEAKAYWLEKYTRT